jgi:SAM-dependent methyltransferase
MSASSDSSSSMRSHALTLLGSAHSCLVHSRRVRVLAELFAELLPYGHTVLDVGCGDGLVAALIAEKRRDVTMSGVDVLPRPHTHISMSLFDGQQLPFGDNSVDTVLFCDVLHHTRSPVVLLKEAQRVARHSVLIKDHISDGPLARLTLRLMDCVGNAPHGVVLPYNYLSTREWDAALIRTGLTCEFMKRKLNLYPWWADCVFGRTLHFIGRYSVTR